MNNHDMYTLAPRPLHSDSSRPISEELHKGQNNGSIAVYLMSQPGLRREKFERNPPGILASDDQVHNYGGGSQFVLGLNGSTSSANTAMSLLNHPSNSMVTTEKPTPGNAVLNIPSSPRRSSLVIDEKNLHLVRNCKSCGAEFKENETKAVTKEQWLDSDMCSACQKRLNDRTAHNTQGEEKEEEVNSCCLC